MASARKSNPVINSSNNTKGKFYCGHCNGNNQTADKCYHLHGFPLEYKVYKKNEKSGNRIKASVNNLRSYTPIFTHE